MIFEQEVEQPTKDTTVIEEPFNVCIFPDAPTVDFEKWKKYLCDSLALDDVSVDTIPPGRYTVFVQFTVDENGRLRDVSILKEPGYGIGERVKKRISNSQGIWKPVIDKNGKAILSYRSQLITFVIDDEEECEEKLPVEFML